MRCFIELTALQFVLGAIQWERRGLEEICKRSSGEVLLQIDPRYFQPSGVERCSVIQSSPVSYLLVPVLVL